MPRNRDEESKAPSGTIYLNDNTGTFWVSTGSNDMSTWHVTRGSGTIVIGNVPRAQEDLHLYKIDEDGCVEYWVVAADLGRAFDVWWQHCKEAELNNEIAGRNISIQLVGRQEGERTGYRDDRGGSLENMWQAYEATQQPGVIACSEW